MSQIEHRILFEDNHLIIVNKLSGEIVQGDKSGDVPMVEVVRAYLKEKYKKPGNVFCGLVHRLDRPVSGVIIFAKTSKALARMNALLQSREVEKKYWAIVEGKVKNEKEQLTHFLKKNEKMNKSFVVKENQKGALKAELIYQKIKLLDHYSLLEINLLTGRHHQIRAQLAAIGHPIQGDVKYGAKRSNENLSISLHAKEISFIHPTSKELQKIIALPPQEGLWKYFHL